MSSGENRPEHDLANEEEWDFEAAEMRAGVVKPRAVVSVAFARSDFERVSAAAEAQHMRTSEFIRVAALEKTVRTTTALVTSSSPGPRWVETHLSTPNQVYNREPARTGVGAA